LWPLNLLSDRFRMRERLHLVIVMVVFVATVAAALRQGQ
jgi:hypothetical protein